MSRHFSPYPRFSLLLGFALSLYSLSAEAATFTVTNLNDSDPGSLRQAIFDANTAAGDDIIVFQSGLIGTITLTSGEIVISDNLTINGPGANILEVSGNHTSRVFFIRSATVVINGLKIKNGLATFDIGGKAHGGGIYNESGILTINNSILSGNSASREDGGAIYNEAGVVTVTDSILSGNLANYGGGISNFGTFGRLTILNSTLSNNSAVRRPRADEGGGGGGIINSGTLTVVNSTISNNSAYDGGGISTSATETSSVINSTLSGNSAHSGGGGISNGGQLAVINSTLSGNSAHSGGGISSYYSTLTVINSTLSGNSATISGGGIASGGFNGVLMIGNSLVAGNNASSGREIFAATITDPDYPPHTFTSKGHNLFGENGFSGVEGGSLDRSDIIPPTGVTVTQIIRQLANYRGPTKTHLTKVDSLAIDAGDNTLVPIEVITDQRGFPRIWNDTVDIGAVERRVRSYQRIGPIGARLSQPAK